MPFRKRHGSQREEQKAAYTTAKRVCVSDPSALRRQAEREIARAACQQERPSYSHNYHPVVRAHVNGHHSHVQGSQPLVLEPSSSRVEPTVLCWSAQYNHTPLLSKSHQFQPASQPAIASAAVTEAVPGKTCTKASQRLGQTWQSRQILPGDCPQPLESMCLCACMCAHECMHACVKRFGWLLTARSSELTRMIEGSLEQCQNERVGETGDPRENLPTSEQHKKRPACRCLKEAKKESKPPPTAVEPTAVDCRFSFSDGHCIKEAKKRKPAPTSVAEIFLFNDHKSSQCDLHLCQSLPLGVSQVHSHFHHPLSQAHQILPLLHSNYSPSTRTTAPPPPPNTAPPPFTKPPPIPYLNHQNHHPLPSSAFKPPPITLLNLQTTIHYPPQPSKPPPITLLNHQNHHSSTTKTTTPQPPKLPLLPLHHHHSSPSIATPPPPPIWFLHTHIRPIFYWFHINQHTGARPYQCPYCPKAFASSGNCFSHRKRMHPLEVERDHWHSTHIERSRELRPCVHPVVHGMYYIAKRSTFMPGSRPFFSVMLYMRIS
ncbi:hypothetical protein PR048_012410, partial [Dryococelus australis]